MGRPALSDRTGVSDRAGPLHAIRDCRRGRCRWCPFPAPTPKASRLPEMDSSTSPRRETTAPKGVNWSVVLKADPEAAGPDVIASQD